uniref:Uncharacterized protein n=1 Tax=Romanomermis culicivorax TaxID=13658 RepID=A0A915JY04_ROMCU
MTHEQRRARATSGLLLSENLNSKNQKRTKVNDQKNKTAFDLLIMEHGRKDKIIAFAKSGLSENQIIDRMSLEYGVKTLKNGIQRLLTKENAFGTLERKKGSGGLKKMNVRQDRQLALGTHRQSLGQLSADFECLSGVKLSQSSVERHLAPVDLKNYIAAYDDQIPALINKNMALFQSQEGNRTFATSTISYIPRDNIYANELISLLDDESSLIALSSTAVEFSVLMIKAPVIGSRACRLPRPLSSNSASASAHSSILNFFSSFHLLRHNVSLGVPNPVMPFWLANLLVPDCNRTKPSLFNACSSGMSWPPDVLATTSRYLLNPPLP